MKDVLNFIVLFSKELIDLFEPFEPHNLIIDSDSGTFNRTFSWQKDTALGALRLFNL